jgi:hypothetical protein
MRSAVVPETVQMAVLAELKLTASPELAVAFSESMAPTTWLPIGLKVIVCGCVPVDVTVTVCALEVEAG